MSNQPALAGPRHQAHRPHSGRGRPCGPPSRLALRALCAGPACVPTCGFLMCRISLQPFFAAYPGILLVRRESVNDLAVATRGRVVVPHAFHERSKIVECDAAIDLDQRPFDDVLELRRADRARTVEGK